MTLLANPGNTRSTRILTWLIAQKGWRPLAQIKSSAVPECSSTQLHGTMTCLVARKKAKRKHVKGVTMYRAEATAMVDRRTRAHASRPTNARMKRLQSSTAESAPLQPTTEQPPKSSPTVSRDVVDLFLMGIDAKRELRDQISADIATFEAGGGVVQKLSWGESSETIARRQAKFLDQRKRGRESQRAARARLY